MAMLNVHLKTYYFIIIINNCYVYLYYTRIFVYIYMNM